MDTDGKAILKCFELGRRDVLTLVDQLLVHSALQKK